MLILQRFSEKHRWFFRVYRPISDTVPPHSEPAETICINEPTVQVVWAGVDLRNYMNEAKKPFADLGFHLRPMPRGAVSNHASWTFRDVALMSRDNRVESFVGAPHERQMASGC
jgi:hypothetical protein